VLRGQLQEEEKTSKREELRASFNRGEIDATVISSVTDAAADTAAKSITTTTTTTHPRIFLVRGNHERVNYELLFEPSTKADKDKSDESVAKYYTAHATLKEDAELANKFRALYDVARPFYACLSNDTSSRSFYVTHSPCEPNHLGKIDTKSLRRQNYTYLNREQPVEGQLLRLIGSDLHTAPFHLAGRRGIFAIRKSPPFTPSQMPLRRGGGRFARTRLILSPHSSTYEDMKGRELRDAL
jgi:hypothetical protein